MRKHKLMHQNFKINKHKLDGRLHSRQDPNWIGSVYFLKLKKA